MKKLSVLVLAAMAMISCGNTYKIQQPQLANTNDSVNYALGFANGAQIKMYQLANDSDNAVVYDFIDALQRGWDGKVEELSEAANVGKQLGGAIKRSEKTGLADNTAWTLNEKIFLQALVNGIYGDSTVMVLEDARTYFQNAYQASETTDTKAGKCIKGNCPTAAKTIALKSNIDSLNYAFGLINGSEIKMYVLNNDSDGTMVKDMIKYLNKALKSNVKNPQAVEMGEQIGKTIKEQSEQGLIGVESLATDFELIKQGFINSMLGDTVWNAMDAGAYIEETINNIKYGNVKAEGEQYLAENALKDGVTTTASGLQYEVIKMGKGPKPAATDKVKVHYHGTLIDGTVFDSSVDRGEPITFGLNQVIPGWTEGVQLMPVGSKFRFVIPQELAYGSRQMGNIPPYSTLIFEVELLGIEK